eukprot:13631374-Alexandrium_andersonii.AAC.1
MARSHSATSFHWVRFCRMACSSPPGVRSCARYLSLAARMQVAMCMVPHWWENVIVRAVVR